MISQRDRSALKKAIHKEGQPLITKNWKILFAIGAVSAAIGAVFISNGIPYGGYLVLFGIASIVTQVSQLPGPWPHGSEEFHRKPLRVATIEKLRESLTTDAMAQVVAMKEYDSAKCVRVGHLFHLLDEVAKADDEARTREIAERQNNALMNSSHDGTSAP